MNTVKILHCADIHIGAAESAIFTNFNTLFALIGAYIFLGEKLIVTDKGRKYSIVFLVEKLEILGYNVQKMVFRRWLKY